MAPSMCAICGKAATTKCVRCHAATYCSADCQKKDWALHKILCKKYLAFLQTRPVAEDKDKRRGDVLPVIYKLAILFPATTETPELIWLKIHTRSEYDDEVESGAVDPEYHYWQNSTYDLTNHMDAPRAMPYTRNGQKLDIYMGDHCFGSEPFTKSLLTLNAGYSSCEHGSIAAAPWAGNLVVVNMTRKLVKHPENPSSDDFDSADKEYHHDVTLSDFRYAFDYLTRQNYIFESTKPNPYYIRKEGVWFKAVKISCSGEMTFEGKKKYSEVAISRYHPIFSSRCDDISSISLRLGFPFCVMKIPPNPVWREYKARMNPAFDPYENLETFYLMRGIEVKSKNWGNVERAKWDVGWDPTILVARHNMRDLTAHQVEALICYSRAVLDDQIVRIQNAENETSEEDIEKIRKEFLKEYLFSPKFAEFFEELKQEKIAKGDATWADASVPPKGLEPPDEVIATPEDEHESLMRMIGMW